MLLSQAELESHLQRRQLPIDGLKGDLIDRLYTHLQTESASVDEAPVVAQQQPEEAPVAVVVESAVDEDDGPTSIDDLLAWKKVPLTLHHHVCPLAHVALQPELQAALASRGLVKTGTKAQLAERLWGAMQADRNALGFVTDEDVPIGASMRSSLLPRASYPSPTQS